MRPPAPPRFAPEPASLDLIQMCWDGNLVAVQRLLDDGDDANAVERDEVEGSDVNWPPHCGLGRTPLLIACEKGHLELARLLIDRGADKEKANNDKNTPLLLDRGANTEKANNDGSTPLLLACDKGHLEVARLLLDRGADVEKAGEDGGTLLLYGARFDGHLEVARLFLDHGADKDAADEDG